MTQLESMVMCRPHSEQVDKYLNQDTIPTLCITTQSYLQLDLQLCEWLFRFKDIMQTIQYKGALVIFYTNPLLSFQKHPFPKEQGGNPRYSGLFSQQ